MKIEVEKPSIQHIEAARTEKQPDELSDVPAFDKHQEHKLIRKVDLRLLPILGALYSIALIDRTNISNARVAGMDEDLELSVGNRYTTALVVFFIGYFIFEIPSNIILRKVGSANWLSAIAFAWGLVMLGQGFVKDWRSLAVCRAFLGLFESGFFPGCAYLITCWHVRYDVQKRLAAFYLTSVFVGGLANILAYGLMQMEGLGGLRGWQWIFIIEGLLTIVTSIVAWWLIMDFPDKAAEKKFLTPAEATFIQERIEIDRGDAEPDPLTWPKFFNNLKDFKLWVFALMFMSTVMPAYAFAYFTPTILRGMGYSAGASNALSAPPACAAFFTSMAFAWVGDKYRIRAPVIAIQALICLTGLMIVAYHHNDGVRYFGIFLGTTSCQGNIPAILAYQSNNIRMQSKRAVGSGLQIGFGAVGGIIASTVFREQDAPKYVNGLWTTAGLQFFILLMVSGMTVYFITNNRKVDNGTIKKPIEGQPGFKFTL
ncbi:MFS general substrate transporter [Rhizodiscina lignyota]|uniref:MFS general substrate transporter n=1 Tax=Rhizodiscina lignyota TaxID=1504668 RepID=A0A9P4IIS8_9PEZI|nr:MFS general substrate transporter [Rhizodiscina lignyota]